MRPIEPHFPQTNNKTSYENIYVANKDEIK
jgi:hypothetical protein